MRKLSLFLLIFGFLASDGLAFQNGPRSPRDQRWSNADFSKVDFAAIVAETHRWYPDQDVETVAERVHRNFQYVFFNRLNMNRFLIPPRPKDVAERVVSVLRLNRDITDSIEDGWQQVDASGEDSRSVERQIIRRIEETAKRLGREFAEFFVEPREATYSFQVPKSSRETRFFHFVRQADRINQRLTRQVEAYFMADSPGAIHLADYDTVTIRVLTESLERLCKISRRGL